jgi:hypothetical protein
MSTATTSKTLNQSKKSKYTKTFLKKAISEQLEKRTFDREKFKTTYKLNAKGDDRKIRRYLNEIITEITKTTPEDLAILRNYCIKNLTKKAAKHKLDSNVELKIALAGTTQEVHVKQEITENKNVNLNVKALLSEYADLFSETDRTTKTALQTDNTT